MGDDKHLLVGGLVAVGFDASGQYLLTISHSGRGVFSTVTWERLARDRELAYPESGRGVGIGPINGQAIDVTELDSEHDVSVMGPDGSFELICTSSDIAIAKRKQ